MPKLRDRLSAARAGWVSGRSVRVPGTAPYWRTSGTRPQRRLAHPTTPQSERPSKGQTIFQGVTALTAVAAVLFTAQSLGYTADATKATRDQVSLAEQGQITERFSRAIDQLGATGPDKLSIRLGGIYALKRIMRDSLADEPTVIEILCAFIRTNTPRKKFPPVEPAAVPSAPEDVRAAVAVLGWRPKPDFEQNSRLDLSGSQLSLSNIWLIDAHLSNVQLVGANLSGSVFSGATLSHSDLGNADLAATDFVGANLVGARMGSASLLHARLAGADLTGVYLAGADLTGSDLTGAKLVGANLGNPMALALGDRNVTAFTYADLTGADLTYARLVGADLANADLTGANLYSSNLSHADLSETSGLTSESLRCAYVDDQTRLPLGVVRPTREGC